MIRLADVRKSYGRKEVLKRVTLDVKRHELLSLVGPSGCGKTTTLNIVAGLCQPDAGTVVLDDVVVEGSSDGRLVHVNPSERKVGYVFQDYALFPHMKVHKNISYGLDSKHLAKSEVKKRTDFMLRFVGLEDYSENYPDQLSGGQKQRVALARALAPEPDILLLDEPLAALDPRTRESLRTELKKILGTLEITTIYVTHELGEAYAVSDMIAVMGHGIIEQTGRRDEIFAKPNSAYVADFLGENVYDGKIVSNNARATIIEINRASFAVRNTRLETWKSRAVLVTIRPEAVLLSTEATTEGQNWNGGRYSNFEGMVSEIIRMRSTAEVKVDVGFPIKSVISASSLNQLGLREGDRVAVHLNVDTMGITPIS